MFSQSTSADCAEKNNSIPKNYNNNNNNNNKHSSELSSASELPSSLPHATSMTMTRLESAKAAEPLLLSATEGSIPADISSSGPGNTPLSSATNNSNKQESIDGMGLGLGLGLGLSFNSAISKGLKLKPLQTLIQDLISLPFLLSPDSSYSSHYSSSASATGTGTGTEIETVRESTSADLLDSQSFGPSLGATDSDSETSSTSTTFAVNSAVYIVRSSLPILSQSLNLLENPSTSPLSASYSGSNAVQNAHDDDWILFALLAQASSLLKSGIIPYDSLLNLELKLETLITEWFSSSFRYIYKTRQSSMIYVYLHI
jgi:hypothetical protein